MASNVEGEPDAATDASDGTHPIERYFPTEPWLESYRVALEENEKLSETGSGWGVGWEGSFVFRITDVPVDENAVDDLPPELVEATAERLRALDDGAAESLAADAGEPLRSEYESREGSPSARLEAAIRSLTLEEATASLTDDLRAELPGTVAELFVQLEENLSDDRTVYSYLDVYDGGCREVAVLDGLDEREHGFVITGEYDRWKKLVEGEGGVINMLMSGELDVDGDMQRILQYTEAAVDLADTSASLDSRFVV